MKDRIDAFIIWPHGLKNKKGIIELISKDFDVLYIKQIKVRSMKGFVKAVYNFDYAPFVHLKNKTKYLEGIGNDVMCIVVRNKKPELDLFDVGKFRHIECTKVKSKKAQIRNKYNPRLDGKLSEEHVIHASDNEQQSYDIMRLFKIPKEISIRSQSGTYHINKGNSYQLRYVKLNDIYCFNFELNDKKIRRVERDLINSVQYDFIQGNKEKYEEYLDMFLGVSLHDLYSSTKFENFIHGFEFERCPPILIKEDSKGRYYILDGLHRATMVKSLGIKEIKAMVIK
ncbi:ParB N-terminal domain-containing protein [Vibrio cholerae]|nr:ParB N-terminal domain-containing protein [Vibrio cholerae]